MSSRKYACIAGFGLNLFSSSELHLLAIILQCIWWSSSSQKANVLCRRTISSLVYISYSFRVVWHHPWCFYIVSLLPSILLLLYLQHCIYYLSQTRPTYQLIQPSCLLNSCHSNTIVSLSLCSMLASPPDSCLIDYLHLTRPIFNSSLSHIEPIHINIALFHPNPTFPSTRVIKCPCLFFSSWAWKHCLFSWPKGWCMDAQNYCG